MGLPPPPAPARARIRWGVSDALAAWFAGTIVGLFAAAPLVPRPGARARDEIPALLVQLFAQGIGTVGYVAFVSARSRGLGSLAADFGVRLGGPADLLALPGGVVAALALGLAMQPIADLAGLHRSSQQVVRQLERSTGGQTALFVLGVLVVAPVAEELLFRGVLLRSLMRRTTPLASVVVSALGFAAIHLLDLGTAPYLPALVALGLCSGWLAVTTGRIGPSILLHAGFNLLTVLTVR